MIQGPFAYAFGLGLVAAVNPCGFAMLPAYLSYFLGLDGGARPHATVPRALAVGLTLTAGFVAVFAVVGFIVENITDAVRDVIPYATIGIGAGLVVLGVAMLAGHELVLRLPHLERGGRTAELPSMFVFGISYAVASLSCTLPIFLAVTSTTFRHENLLSGTLTFVMYGLGMGSLVVVLTIATAFAKTSITGAVRRLLPYVHRVSGALLVLAGLYVAYYGWYEIRLQDTIRRDPVVDFFTARQGELSQWVTGFGPARLGGILAVVIAASVMVPVLWRGRRTT